MPPIPGVLRRAAPSRARRRLAIAAVVGLGLASILAHAFREPAWVPAEPVVSSDAWAGLELPTPDDATLRAEPCAHSQAGPTSRESGAYCPRRSTPDTKVAVAAGE
jgi:hypothetical protein